ncbi:hypothetical protein KUA50_002395 [Segatella hominis]|uniref:hypothetical protein n=1 Tax=Segatella hominis TaxID=2518605 RepID=UPI001C43D5E4|nr:hypothetical protein [Segatella hominis]WOZ81836.1 hypothetical protein KUA50_002395 [Segatella hominis]
MLKQIIHRYLALYHAILGIFCHSIGRNEGEVQSLAGTGGFSEQLTAIDNMFQIGKSNLEGFPPEYEDTKIMLLFEFRKRY